MSYLTQSRLSQDPPFTARSLAALTEQALVYLEDERPDIQGLARAVLAGGRGETSTFLNLLAGSPGFAAKVEVGGTGGIDSGRITDAELLAAVQHLWPTVTGLYFNSDGSAKPQNP